MNSIYNSIIVCVEAIEISFHLGIPNGIEFLNLRLSERSWWYYSREKDSANDEMQKIQLNTCKKKFNITERSSEKYVDNSYSNSKEKSLSIFIYIWLYSDCINGLDYIDIRKL